MANPELSATSIAAAAIGPFIGAGLAFLAAKLHDRSRRQREELAAGRLALFKLSALLNDFLVYRAGVRRGICKRVVCGPETPAWLLAHPVAFHFDEGLAIDFTALSFLFEGPGSPDTYGRVRLAQTLYFDLKARNADMIEAGVELQKLIAELQRSNPDVSLAMMVAAAGPELVGRADSFVRSVVDRISLRTEAQYRSAFTTLREALKARYPDAILPELAEDDPKFAEPNLAPLPRAFAPGCG